MAHAPRSTESSRPSDMLLLVALAVTVFVAGFGSAVLWHLYESYRGTLTLPARSAESPDGEPLVICVARTPGGPSEWMSYARVFAKLQRDLDRPVRLHYALDRAEASDMLRQGKVDLTFLAVQDYFRAEEDVPVQIIATPVIDGHTQDAAVLLVHADSDIDSIEDLRGKRILLADDLAGVGYANWLFGQELKGFKDLLRPGQVSGVQDTNLTEVAAGRADATCVRRTALSGWPESEFRILSTSPAFGMSPLAARADLDPRTVAAVRRSLLSSDTAALLPSDSGVDGFIVPPSEDYDFTRMLYEAKRARATAREADVSR